MDNQAAGALTEQIEKERKITARKMAQMEEAGLLPGADEIEAAERAATARIEARNAAARDLPLPPQLERLQKEPDLKRQTEISKALWASTNAAYLLRDGKALKSASHDDFRAPTADEIAFMKSHGAFDPRHHRCGKRL